MVALSRERLTGFTIGFALVGVMLTSWLVISEIFRESTCPALLGVPACYIVLAAYVAAAVGALRMGPNDTNRVFLVGAGVVTIVAFYLSINQLRGVTQCPRFEGLPMCYVSLLAGTSMLGATRLRPRVKSTDVGESAASSR